MPFSFSETKMKSAPLAPGIRSRLSLSVLVFFYPFMALLSLVLVYRSVTTDLGFWGHLIAWLALAQSVSVGLVWRVYGPSRALTLLTIQSLFFHAYIALGQFNLGSASVIVPPLINLSLLSWLVSIRVGLVYYSLVLVGYGTMAWALHQGLAQSLGYSSPLDQVFILLINLVLALPIFLLPSRIMRKSLQEAQHKESLLTQAMNSSRQLFGLVSPGGLLLFANTRALELIDHSPAEVLDQPFWTSPWFSHDPEQMETIRQLLQDASLGRCSRSRITHRNQKGQTRLIDFSLSPILDQQGHVSQILAEGQDITDEILALEARENLERQLLASQKMEALGRLAGGVAHDFNNSLAAIMGICELLLTTDPDPERARQNIQRILDASKSAAQLTRRLLEFSPRKIEENQVMDLDALVKKSIFLLDHSLPRTVRIHYQSPDTGYQILGSESQIQSALVNLGINASHAMPEGGTLEIVLEPWTPGLLDSATWYQSPPEGAACLLSVKDTGTGIATENLPHIFEPFFTTKDRDQGTGLGLPSVYGTISRHSGGLALVTQLGQGSTFHIVLPLV